MMKIRSMINTLLKIFIILHDSSVDFGAGLKLRTHLSSAAGAIFMCKSKWEKVPGNRGVSEREMFLKGTKNL